MHVLRTPDDRFADLPGFPCLPHHVEVEDGEGGRLRVAHLDERPRGGETVLLLHGEPSWSFPYRTTIPPLASAGLRVNTGPPTGDHPMSEAFLAWQRYSQDTPELRVGRIVAGGCRNPMPPDVVAAYDAPFPDDTYKAGAQVFPMLVPTPDDPAAEANRRAWAVLSAWDEPFLTAFSDADPIAGGGDRMFHKLVPGAAGREHVTLAGGGHFLQEDLGPEFAAVLAQFVATT